MMEWTDITVTVPKAEADAAEAIATMIANGGIYVEDYSDLEEKVREIAHMDLIEQELLDKPRDRVTVHLYLSPDEAPGEVRALLEQRLQAAGVNYRLALVGIRQEDWQNAWKQYYHPVTVGRRLAVVPQWETFDTGRIVLKMDPGMAFGTGTHETTVLCLEALDELIRGGERVLDIGCGSGILAIAALKLGAARAEGVDIDPMCVRTAGENAALNGIGPEFTVRAGDLAEHARGRYDVITANIVAAAIQSLAPAVPALLAPGGLFIASGIIDTRKDEVMDSLRRAGLRVEAAREKRGWVCLLCRAAQD